MGDSAVPELNIESGFELIALTTTLSFFTLMVECNFAVSNLYLFFR